MYSVCASAAAQLAIGFACTMPWAFTVPSEPGAAQLPRGELGRGLNADKHYPGMSFGLPQL